MMYSESYQDRARRDVSECSSKIDRVVHDRYMASKDKKHLLGKLRKELRSLRATSDSYDGTGRYADEY